ncbi:MAG: hypothetical protein J0I51_03660 [Microbacterium sp.]|nr:hypothetical protein [Microbacterium sp.]
MSQHTNTNVVEAALIAQNRGVGSGARESARCDAFGAVASVMRPSIMTRR